MTLGKGATDDDDVKAGHDDLHDDVQAGQGKLQGELWTMMIMGQMMQYRMSVMKLMR